MSPELIQKMIDALLNELQEKQKLIDGMKREITILHAHIAELESGDDQEDEDKPVYHSLNDPLKNKL